MEETRHAYIYAEEGDVTAGVTISDGDHYPAHSMHILCACPKSLGSGMYTWRHDQVLF